MEANELRINNYYELKGSVLDGGICQLKNLNDFIHIGNLIKNDLVKPIPLTEEWLLKFGFEKNFENLIEILINKNQSLHFDKTDNCMSLYIPINHEFIYLVFKHIKYVHQLQNLFYSICGTELEIKQ